MEKKISQDGKRTKLFLITWRFTEEVAVLS